MPIASAAAYSRTSSKSLHNQSQNNRASNNNTSDDSFFDNQAIPTSIIKGSMTRQPSKLHSFGDNDNSGRSNDHNCQYQYQSSQDYEQPPSLLQYIRTKCGAIVDDERFSLFILLLIAINSIMYGVATFPEVKNSPSLVSTFETIDMVVLVIFTLESILQFTFNGFTKFIKDGWLVFDFIIVTVSWISIEIDELKALRVFRAFRFVTRVSILRNVVVALFSIVPAITAIFTLLLLIFYIYAVMFTQLFKDYYSEGYTSQDYFGRMDYTLFTLFQILCMDEWSGIADEVVSVQYWAWAIFITFIVMSAFVVVNLLIAVICDALQILRTAEEAMVEKLHGSYVEESDYANQGIEIDQNGEIVEGSPQMGDVNGGDNQEVMSKEERVRTRVNEMEAMLEEMMSSQQTMARTIEYLSLALYSDRKRPSDSLGSISESELAMDLSDRDDRGNPQ